MDEGCSVADADLSFKLINMIHDIDHNDFRGADLNLLPVFNALLVERSVTGAARRLNLGQPAVSGALSRLRMLFRDPLFRRSAGRMEPTPRAVQLAGLIEPALGQIRSALSGASAFDPATAERTFCLGMPDSVETALGPGILRRVQECAPGVRLLIRLAGRAEGLQLLDAGQMDLGISYFPSVAARHRREVLFTETYSCLFDGKRLKIPTPISVHDYVARPHLLMSFSGDFEGVVEKPLRRLKLARRVVLSTTRFSTLPFYLRETNSIATLPTFMAEHCARLFSLTLSPTPVRVESFPISMLWHGRTEQDEAQIWLRNVVRECVRRPEVSRSRHGRRR